MNRPEMEVKRVKRLTSDLGLKGADCYEVVTVATAEGSALLTEFKEYYDLARVHQGTRDEMITKAVGFLLIEIKRLLESKTSKKDTTESA